jgi:uncharacterized protein YbbK (DUF523 family)
VPRDPIRVVSFNGDLKLIQPKTGKDVTEQMIEFSNLFLNSISDVDGFILKSKSPSCGIKDVKIYSEVGPLPKESKGSGFFAKAVMGKYPNLTLEYERRLTNSRINSIFLLRYML